MCSIAGFLPVVGILLGSIFVVGCFTFIIHATCYIGDILKCKYLAAAFCIVTLGLYIGFVFYGVHKIIGLFSKIYG